MNPSADVLALASTEVDVSALEEGQSITVKWRGKPVFVRHRTEAEIAEAADTDITNLIDPKPMLIGFCNQNILSPLAFVHI